MLALAIDTSSPAVIAGVVAVDAAAREPAELRTLAERAPQAARGHGELLVPSIEACLSDAGIGVGDLGAVVAGVGPGPYTGLRVGLVTAAAIADAAGLPTYAVCSLDAIAADVVAAAEFTADGELLVATDARRREVYWARYDAGGRRTAGPHVDRPVDVLLDGLSGVAGHGAELYAELSADGQLPRSTVSHASAGALVRLAVDRLLSRAPADPLAPLYLRRPDAVVPGAAKTVLQ